MTNNIGLFKSVFLRIFEFYKEKAKYPQSLRFQKYLVRDPLGIVTWFNSATPSIR